MSQYNPLLVPCVDPYYGDPYNRSLTTSQIARVQPYMQNTVTVTANGISYDLAHLEGLMSYADFIFEMLGIDMSYDKFITLSPDEKKSLLRDIKINKIIPC